jgi:hypothetical protein
VSRTVVLSHGSPKDKFILREGTHTYISEVVVNGEDIEIICEFLVGEMEKYISFATTMLGILAGISGLVIPILNYGFLQKDMFDDLKRKVETFQKDFKGQLNELTEKNNQDIAKAMTEMSASDMKEERMPVNKSVSDEAHGSMGAYNNPEESCNIHSAPTVEQEVGADKDVIKAYKQDSDDTSEADREENQNAESPAGTSGVE